MPIPEDFPKGFKPIGRISLADGEQYPFRWGPGKLAEASKGEKCNEAFKARGEKVEPVGVSGTMVAVDWDACVADSACIEAWSCQVFRCYRTEEAILARRATAVACA